MHAIDRIPPHIRSAIYDEIFRVLKDYASGGRHEIELSHIFLLVADNLAEANIIGRLDRMRYSGFKTDYLTDAFPNYNVPQEIAALFRQIIWELFTKGILAPSFNIRGNDKHIFHFDLDSCSITNYGVQVLLSTDDRVRVYDPDGYLSLFWSANPPSDPVMVRYLSEVVQTFRSNNLLATVIVLGTASERLIDSLAERLRDALGTTRDGVGWYKTYLSKWSITRKFDELIRKLQSEYQIELKDNGVSNREFDTIKMTFEAIRHPRNIIVHQHTYTPTWNETAGLLHNFVLYFKLINQITGILVANPR